MKNEHNPALKKEFQQALSKQFTQDQYYTHPADCWAYGYDNSRRHALPHAVIFATSHDDIVKAITLCYEHEVPITARGRATGTAGGCVPLHAGVVLSLERMEKILAFSEKDRYIIAEPGVLNIAVQNEAKKKGFFWAPDPSSAPYCSIGGNLACNAAGPRSLKYGTTRENTLGLTAVIGTGKTLHCGAYTTKSVVGYDFTRLFIGSEGTLGIFSRAILKLTPLPEAKSTLCAVYKDVQAATAATLNIMASPIIPCNCEFMDDIAVNMVRQHSAPLPLAAEAGGLLLFEVDGPRETLSAQIKAIKKAATNAGLLELFVANSAQEAEKLWNIRKCLSQTLRSLSPHKINEDIVVPITNIPALLDYIKTLAKEYHFPIVSFGHAGNGNLHVNILVDPHDPVLGPKAKACLNKLFDKVLALRGSLSGEHGIGIEKIPYINKELDSILLDQMQKVKTLFDPKGILNPGKVF